jgi:hypothetical protein
LICYYRFGFVSIIIAGKYYFFGWIDMLFEPLPTATIGSTAPWLELLDNVVLLLQGIFSDRWDCNFVLASSFPVAFINTFALYSIGPDSHATAQLLGFLPGHFVQLLAMPSTGLINAYCSNIQLARRLPLRFPPVKHGVFGHMSIHYLTAERSSLIVGYYRNYN